MKTASAPRAQKLDTHKSARDALTSRKSHRIRLVLIAAAGGLLLANTARANASDLERSMWLATHGIETSLWATDSCKTGASRLVELTDAELARAEVDAEFQNVIENRLELATRLAIDSKTAKGCWISIDKDIPRGFVRAYWENQLPDIGRCLNIYSYHPGSERQFARKCGGSL